MRISDTYWLFSWSGPAAIYILFIGVIVSREIAATTSLTTAAAIVGGFSNRSGSSPIGPGARKIGPGARKKLAKRDHSISSPPTRWATGMGGYGGGAGGMSGSARSGSLRLTGSDPRPKRTLRSRAPAAAARAAGHAGRRAGALRPAKQGKAGLQKAQLQAALRGPRARVQTDRKGSRRERSARKRNCCCSIRRAHQRRTAGTPNG